MLHYHGERLPNGVEAQAGFKSLSSLLYRVPVSYGLRKPHSGCAVHTIPRFYSFSTHRRDSSGASSQHLRACSFAANRDSPLFFAAFLIKGSNPTPAQPPTRPAGDAGEHFLPACHFSYERGEMLIQSTQVIRDKDRTRSLPIPGPWDLPFAVLMPSTPGPDQFTVRPPF